MSRNVKKSTPLKKYCKICFDTGKTPDEYLSHFIRENRDPNSKVVCPTLLNLKCNYCFKNAHTVKYCPMLKMGCGNCFKNGHSVKYCPVLLDKCVGTLTHPIQKIKIEEKHKEMSSTYNIYSCLDCDLPEEINNNNEEIINELKEEFPELTKPPLIRLKSESINYVAAVCKPFVPKSEEMAPFPPIKPKPIPWNSGIPKASTMDWASWDTESESEEEEFEQLTIIKKK